MKAFFKALGATLAGLVLSATAGQTDTIISVTETHYDALLRPDCVAIRMDTATFANAPANACNLVTVGGANGADRIVKTVYDAAGQVIEIKRASATNLEEIYATYTYTKNGLKSSEADARGNVTRFDYDTFDRLVTLNYPTSSVTTYALQPCAVTPATYTGTSGCTSPQAYTTRVANTPPQGFNDHTPLLGQFSTSDYEAFNYDANGNRVNWRRRDGSVFSYAYDNLNRETLKDLPGGNTADVTTAYDLQGHVTAKKFVSPVVGVTYAYDGLGRVKSSVDMNGRTISHQYNQASARTRLTYPNAVYVTYDRDAQNRLKAAYHSSSTSLFAQGFDDLGRRIKLNRGSGVAITTYTFDNAGSLTTFKNDLINTGDDNTWTFGYNAAGQVQTWAATLAVYDYSESQASTVGRTYDGLNRDAAIASVGGGYDLRGNLTKDPQRTFTYDLENRLLTKVSTDGLPNLTLSYDPEGRLYKYAVGSLTTTFTYDGVDLIAEYDTATTPALQNAYVHGDGVDDPVIWFQGAGTTLKHFLITNYQGSVVADADGAGNVVERYRYGPYGEPLNQDNTSGSGWSTGPRFRYTGQTMLKEARLYYYKARVYDPVYGHFLQTDPIGSKDDLDLYAHVGDDPINRIDPTGLEFNDLFKSREAAVMDFAKTYHDVTIEDGHERGTRIYKTGAGMFSYIKPLIGTTRHVGFGEAPKGTKGVGGAHTHPAGLKGGLTGDEPSGDDTNFASNRNVTIFTVGSKGSVSVTTPGAKIPPKQRLKEGTGERYVSTTPVGTVSTSGKAKATACRKNRNLEICS